MASAMVGAAVPGLGDTDAFGCKHKTGVGTWATWRRCRHRAGARRGVRWSNGASRQEGRTIRGGRDHPGAHNSPAPLPPLFSRIIFRYGLDMQLDVARTLSGKKILYCRRVYFSEARTIAPLPGGDAVLRAGGSGAVIDPQECLQCITAGLTLVAWWGGIKREGKIEARSLSCPRAKRG